MKKRFMATVAMLSVLALVGCSTGAKTETTKAVETKAEEKATEVAASADKKDGVMIGLSMNTQTNPFFVSVQQGVKDAAAKYGIEIVATDAQDDPAIQAKDIENLISMKPAAIIVDTCDSDAIVPAIESCNEAGIPVFTMDRKANGGEVVSHIGYDAIKSGAMAADYLAKALSEKGKVVELQGIMGSNVAQDRHQGFTDEIKKYPNIEVVQSEVANFDRATAMSVMENILSANPEIDGLYAANDEMALGAVEAIEAVGRLDKITIIGCDCIDDTIDAMKEGKIEASISEPPYGLGVSILEAAHTYLEGGKVPKQVVLGNQVLEAKDAANYNSKRDVEIVSQE